MSFPVKHPKAGQPTYFRDSIISGRKIHTIRNHIHRFQQGEHFMPVAWVGMPYKSKTVQLLEPIEVLETYEFEKVGYNIKVNDTSINPETIAANDGLNLQDFFDWFPQQCVGYIICWKSVNYAQYNIAPYTDNQLQLF
jgi:hypothetical protein